MSACRVLVFYQVDQTGGRREGRGRKGERGT